MTKTDVRFRLNLMTDKTLYQGVESPAARNAAILELLEKFVVERPHGDPFRGEWEQAFEVETDAGQFKKDELEKAVTARLTEYSGWAKFHGLRPRSVHPALVYYYPGKDPEDWMARRFFPLERQEDDGSWKPWTLKLQFKDADGSTVTFDSPVEITASYAMMKGV